MKKIYNLQDIVAILPKESNISVLGNVEGIAISSTAIISNAKDSDIVWVNPQRQDKRQLIANTAALLIVCDKETAEQGADLDKCYIVCDNPKLVFSIIVNTFFTPKISWGIHPTAYIHPNAKVHEHSYIGPFTYIGNATIGEGSVIWGHVHVYDHVTIGKNVIIHAGTVLGADGFGYSKNDRGEFEKFPHIGGIVIEDDVEIGANTCIDRGSLGNTHIKRGAKIDNLVHIAHNVIVGENAAVIALAMVGGSTIIGDNAWIAPSASLRDVIRIGNNATVGLGAVVTKNIPDGETWAGVPAKQLSVK